MRKTLPAMLIALSACNQAFAWDGYDFEKGQFIEIEKGNLVRQGRDIEVFDVESGEYKDFEVESIRSTLGGAEIEVRDPITGESRTFDMEK